VFSSNSSTLWIGVNDGAFFQTVFSLFVDRDKMFGRNFSPIQSDKRNRQVSPVAPAKLLNRAAIAGQLAWFYRL
jgi:hypothetical protein